MNLANEHPIIRRKYEQLVALQSQTSFFDQIWVQDLLHANWQYLLDDQQEPIARIPIARKYGLKAYLQPLFIRSLRLYADAPVEELSVLKSKLFLHLNFELPTQFAPSQSYGKYQLLAWQDGIAQIRSRYSENIKRNLKKTKELNMQPISYKQFQTFFIAQKGENLGNLNSSAWSRLDSLFAVAQQKEQAFCVGAWKDDKLLAVGLFFRYKEQLYFMKGTLNEQGKRQSALVFLIDAVLDQFAIECKTLDFVGSNQESIAAFYKKFGATDHYYHIVKGRIPVV